nr:ATP-dependent RNA helicase DHX36-like isoform X2 [Halyomorpha halys]
MKAVNMNQNLIRKLRFPTHGAPIPTDDFIRRRNETSTEEETANVSGIISLASNDIPSTSGEETDDSRPPPGLTGKALGLWHRDRKRKEKKLRKQERRALKEKKKKKKNVAYHKFRKQKKRILKEQRKKKKNVQCIPLELGDEKVDKIRKIIGNVDFDRIKRLSSESVGGSGFNINEKYMDMQDSEFKRRFLKSITGSLENKIKQGGIHTSSLPKRPDLDSRYKEELRDKYTYSHDFKHYLSVREKLPAFKKKKVIIDELEKTNKLLISGETGCGKTTQVAQFLLEHEIVSNRGSTCCILCTQPRRISAISVAERVAIERGERLGESIGYQIRLEKVIPRSSCSILFCTTGVLLKYMQSEPLLTFASHIILDEVHERDTLSDFVITLLRDILPVRPDLKVILMSATLNAEKFSKYFDNCPTVHIPGFTYPVTEYYLEEVLEMTRFQYNLSKQFQKDVIKERETSVMPYLRMLEHEKRYSKEVITSLMHPSSEEINLELIVALLKYICSDPKNSNGAILIFLPGWDKISKLHKMVNENSFFSSSRFVIYPLHSLMPTVSQKSIFSHPPPGQRKIIIATNIAETSITIDDVVFVIDCGKIKIKNFDIDNNITTMKEEWVSLANAQQRKGRAGRVQEGVCYHLFTRGREKMLDQYQLPEMLRTRLEEVILQAKILQLGKVEPFLQKVLDPPSPKAVTLSLMLLFGMRALDEDENLTPLGYHLANLPVDPQAGKMLIFASLFSCFDPIASIAACLGFKDPFIIPVGREKEVDQRKKELCAGMKSDHLLLSEVVSLWERAEERRRGWEFCRSNYLSHNTLTQLCEMKNQFARHLYDMRFLDSDKSRCTSGNFNSNYPGLLKAIVCAGLYPNIAIIKKQKVNRKTGIASLLLFTPEDGKVRLHPKSVNNNQGDFRSRFLVYFEKIKSLGISLHDTTMIPPLALIFFCQNLTITDEENRMGKVITVNEYITFNCSNYVAQLIQDLRTALDWILENKIAHPGISDLCDPYSQSIEARLLRAIVELITIEDEEVNFDESDFSDDMY